MNFLYVTLWIYVSTVTSKGEENNTIPCDEDKYLYMHRCDDGITCIRDKRVCDGVADCPDGSDEKQYTNSSSAEDGIECTVKSTKKKCFLPNDYICDQYSHCMEDECHCSYSHPFKCSENECVDLSLFCNGRSECSNGRDELLYSNKSDGLRCTKFLNKSACALPYQHVCDGTPDCYTAGDECFCGIDNGGVYDETSYFDQTCFRCLDGHGAMFAPYVCDGYIDCIDLSDECLCEDPISICNQLAYKDDCEFRCQGATDFNETDLCITKSRVCDGSRDCPLGEDEKYCQLVRSLMGYVETDYKKKIPEYACCNAGYPADCLNENTFTNATYDGCDKFFECPEDANYYADYKFGIKCDGVPTCVGSTDECTGCNDSLSRAYCAPDRLYGYECPNQTYPVHLYTSDICDGYPSCDSENPLFSADEINCTKRFYCFGENEGEEFISIAQEKLCDCVKDCRDGSDEINCTEYSNFCCQNREESVHKNKTCNGIDDCSDGSDECLPECIDSPFADDKHLISNVALRAFVWIIGFVSSAGNLFVLIHTSLKLHKEKQNEYSKITLFHVLALSFADLCVGIYLISLGAVDAAYAGVYCYREKLWRSGKYCNLMGVISMFGIQASVFMLTMMTLNRLHTILRPYRQPNAKISLALILLLLLVAVVLSVVPVISSVEDYFTSHVRFQKNPFVQRDINRFELSSFANKLASYHTFNTNFQSFLGESQTQYSWQSLFTLMRHLNETFEPQFEFGYYSSHGVCLPKVFPEKSDSTWQYSMLIISINFVSFITILLSYVKIYWVTVVQRSPVGNRKSDVYQKMQKKITRIIVTDFCCWMPICVIAFIKISGIEISNEVYAIAAIVILPINSAINPFLYSNLPDVIWRKAGKAYEKFHSQTAAASSNNETDITRIEMKNGRSSVNRSI